MRPAPAWREELAREAPGTEAVVEMGRKGQPTLRVEGVYLHSRYDPEREAAQLIDSAQLDPKRPVLVVGLGLGYHVAALVQRGFTVAVLEPCRGIARAALADAAVVADGFDCWVGGLDALDGNEAFQALAKRMPQWLVHPPTARLHPQYVGEAAELLARCALRGTHLSVAVVGPMYGGSLPITDYLARAFEKLGHRVLHAGNGLAWPLYDAATKSLQSAQAQGQLGGLLTHFLNEWSYARVAEFAPDICVVMAQAPVNPSFAARLRERGIITAFWFVENWRHMPYWRDVAREYDFFFHIQPGAFETTLDEIGCANHAFVQTGCDPSIHRPVELTEDERDEFGCDLSFAGAGYPNRNAFFRGLTDYDFKIWGVNWTARELAGKVQRREQRFTPDDFMKMVAAAKINLNLHSSTQADGVDPKCDAVNPRVFEIAAAGGFQLCDPCIGLETHFDLEDEVPAYTDLASLRARIDYYLAHPGERVAVAKRAQERALAEHTYEHRAQQMLDFIIARQGHRLLRKGVRVQRTIGETAAMLGKESALGAYLAQLPPALLFTHDVMKEVINLDIDATSYPARVFNYLTEVRSFAEILLKEDR
jgi:spore maturation protein CgeB